MNEPLFTLPLGSWVETFVDWLTDTFAVIFTFIMTVLEGLYDALDLVLGGPPPLLIAVVLALLAFFAKGWKLAVGTLVGMLVIQSVGQIGRASCRERMERAAGVVGFDMQCGSQRKLYGVD